MLEWSSLVPGPEDKSSSSESRNPTSFTISYQFCSVVRIMQYIASSEWLLALGNVNLGFLQVFPWLDCSFLFQFSSVQSCPALCDLMDCSTPGLPCPSPTPRGYSNSCPLSPWCHPAISSSVVPFSSHLQSFPASGSFPRSQFLTSGDQVLEFQLQHQSFQWTFKTDFL